MNDLWSSSQAFEHFLFGQNMYKLTRLLYDYLVKKWNWTGWLRQVDFKK